MAAPGGVLGRSCASSTLRFLRPCQACPPAPKYARDHVMGRPLRAGPSISSQGRRTFSDVTDTAEALALELSRAALQSQDCSENQLREKATAILSAASIVVPVAVVALGDAAIRAAIPFGVAALAYFWCARSCGAALFPKDRRAGLLGGDLLRVTAASGAELRQMQASAANYLDDFYRHNQTILETAAERIREAIIALGIEIFALAAAMVSILVR